jgi:hypothetical protein
MFRNAIADLTDGQIEVREELREPLPYKEPSVCRGRLSQ